MPRVPIDSARLPLGRALLAWAILAASAAHAGTCQIVRSPDIPVTMSGLRPVVHAQINGQDAALAVDSGAFFSMLTPAAARPGTTSSSSSPAVGSGEVRLGCLDRTYSASRMSNMTSRTA